MGPNALALYATEDAWAPLDSQGWEHVRSEVLAPWGARVMLRGPPGPGEGYSFDYCGKPVGEPSVRRFPGTVCALQFWLPTEFLEEHGPERVHALALELAEPLPYCSGHAGLAFQGDWNLLGVTQEVQRYCFLYPGLDIVPLERLSRQLGTRVRGPAWMTFLGSPVLGALGNTAGLRARLSSPGTSVQSLDAGRAVVTLGERPEAGDTRHPPTLPSYRELARVLEPWTYFEEQISDPDFPHDSRLRWERRFLD
ncbi:DUF3396 domain-containing protein [Stigmatella sp. ncwal1]|uniref:DUF3396 domain-containing protein n=1 Tax=Stigmatella ashevillensis TaxID=2995309 RepID=A0ABT5DBC4_9BACT|nr:DUF3396 domain-containing protein [Stigmatella ashevillena]MDC0710899.1 DUF3396 domain-containing protein [Stigmatella ashevillena]